MARPKRIRKIERLPGIKGYVPIGGTADQEPVIINLEEYESIRLSDFELLDHFEAAGRMGVSRPTFTRIYESARRKVATAFCQQKPMVFEGGKVYFNSQWYSCNTCGCLFNRPGNEPVTNCALCGSPQVEKYSE